MPFNEYSKPVTAAIAISAVKFAPETVTVWGVDAKPSQALNTVGAPVTVMVGVKIETCPAALNVNPQEPFCNLARYKVFLVTFEYAWEVDVLAISIQTKPLSSERCHFWIVPVWPERVRVPEFVVEVCEAFDTEPPTGGVPFVTVTVMVLELTVALQALTTAL